MLWLIVGRPGAASSRQGRFLPANGLRSASQALFPASLQCGFCPASCPAFPAAARGHRRTVGQLRSVVLAPGAFFFTEAMPFSMAAADEYISLLPMIWPLAAFRLK